MCLEEREGRLHLLHRRWEWGSQRILEEKVYDLELPAARSRVLKQGGEGPDFWAYVDDGRRLHYVSYWLPNKIRLMRVPRESLAAFEVLSPHYARVGTRLYCRGAWVPEADADRFQLIPETRFAHDGERVYAFTITEGLDVLEVADGPPYFLPRCEHFADQRDFYWQSSWTRRIERVSGATPVDAYEKKISLLAVLWHDTEPRDEAEALARDTLLDGVHTIADLFRLALPDARAAWARAPRSTGSPSWGGSEGQADIGQTPAQPLARDHEDDRVAIPVLHRGGEA